MGELVVIVCTFNYRLWKETLPQLPTMSALKVVEIPTYASSTWTVPGTIAVLTGKQEWEKPTKPELSWTNFPEDWWENPWDFLWPDFGRGAAYRLVEGWDRKGTAFLFYRLPHFPYGIGDPVALQHLANHESEPLEWAYKKRLKYLDKEMSELLELDCPILVTGDHGEDFGEWELMHMHHNNHSDEVIRVPMFGRGFRYDYPTVRHVCNKHALAILREEPLSQSDTIRIWSEGPFEGEWKYIIVDWSGKTVVSKDGMFFEPRDNPNVFESMSDHSKLNARLRALGYL